MQLMLPVILNHRALTKIYGVICSLAIFALLIMVVTPQVSISNDVTFNQLSCSDVNSSARASHANDRLNILIPTHTVAIPLLQELCDNAILNAKYKHIAVHWLPREDLSPQMIYNQRFDVLWARDYQLAGLTPDYKQYYRGFSSLPGYDVYWLSRSIIDEHQLSTVNIGLLDDVYSRSGYQLPMQVLGALSVEQDSAQIRRYPSRKALALALQRGEVDIIPATSFNPLTAPNSGLYRMTIADDVSAGGWFASINLSNTPELHAVSVPLKKMFGTL